MSDENTTEGRRVPPIEKRWKKGVSGNPKGRPPKELSLTSLLKSEIEKVCPADKQCRTWLELIVLATMQLAMKGNASALKEVWERIDGKVMQPGKLEIGGLGGKEVMIKVVYDDGKGGSSENSEQRLIEEPSGQED